LDRKGEPVVLEFDQDGKLAQAAYDKIMEVDLAIIDNAIWLFEKDILLSQV